MKNILIVMSGYFPAKEFGGPPVSVDNLCNLLHDNFNFYIVTKNHDKNSYEPFENVVNGWNERDNCRVLYLNDSEYNVSSFKKVFDEINPDIVYLQGIFSSDVISVINIAKRHKCQIILAPRGTLCKNAISIKKWKKIPFLFLLKLYGFFNGITFQSTSEEETLAIVKYLNVKKSNVYLISNVPSFPINSHSTLLKEKDAVNFIFLSRIHPKKNLLFALKCLAKVKGSITFDIYGPIEDEKYWEECTSLILNMPSNIKVSYKGLIDHSQIHDIFGKYHCFLFPTFSENYGHVIAESLFSGTPVITSDQTPWNEFDSYNCGASISLNCPDIFIKNMQIFVDMNNEKFSRYSENAKRYAYEMSNMSELKEKYLILFSNERREPSGK